MNKAKNQKILKKLKEGHSIRATALLCKASTNLVIKVRDLNEGSIPAHNEKRLDEIKKLKLALKNNPL
jgi:hypothetical protein